MAAASSASPPAEEVTALLLAAAPRLARTRLVAIDGPAGSGKTTLAAQVADAIGARGLSAAMVHMDDLYEGWTGLDTRLETRLLAQVLRPLATGATARWQRYDWHAERFDTWHDLEPPDVLVLEGCGSGAATYAPYTSLLVWVEAPIATRIARGIARDGEQVRSLWLDWMAVEAAHFEANATKRRASLSYRTG